MSGETHARGPVAGRDHRGAAHLAGAVRTDTRTTPHPWRVGDLATVRPRAGRHRRTGGDRGRGAVSSRLHRATVAGRGRGSRPRPPAVAARDPPGGGPRGPLPGGPGV